MVRTALAVQTVVRDSNGLEPVYTAANADGHSVVNTASGRAFLHVKNDQAGAPVVVTVVTAREVHGLAVADLVATIPATEERMIGPFPPSTFNQTDGTVHVDFDVVTTVTCAALVV